MHVTGKIDYVELPAAGASLPAVKAFFAEAFGWSFTDYGPEYAAFNEGLDGGFYSDSAEAVNKPLVILYVFGSTTRTVRSAVKGWMEPRRKEQNLSG